MLAALLTQICHLHAHADACLSRRYDVVRSTVPTMVLDDVFSVRQPAAMRLSWRACQQQQGDSAWLDAL